VEGCFDIPVEAVVVKIKAVRHSYLFVNNQKHGATDIALNSHSVIYERIGFGPNNE